MSMNLNVSGSSKMFAHKQIISKHARIPFKGNDKISDNDVAEETSSPNLLVRFYDYLKRLFKNGSNDDDDDGYSDYKGMWDSGGDVF